MISSLRKSLQGDGLRSRLARGSAGNMILSAASTLLSFGTGVLLARFMGSAQYGVYTYFYEIFMVMAIPAQFGLPTLIVRETAKDLEQESWGKIKGLWRWSGNITAIITLIIAAGTVTYFVLINSSVRQAQLLTLIWGFALVPIASFAGLRGAALRGLHKVIQGQLPELIILPGLYFVFILAYRLFFKSALEPSSAFFLQVLAAAIAFVVGAILLVKTTPAEMKTVAPIFEQKAWLSSVFSLAMLSGMNVLNKRVTIILLGLLVSSSQIGIFKVAAQIAALAEFGIRVANPVVAPEIARLHAMQDTRRLQKLATYSTRAIMAVNFLITAGFALIGKWFLRFFYGPEYVAAYSVVLILLIGQFVNSTTGAVSTFLNMTGYEKDTTAARGLALVITVGLVLAVTPLWGIQGTAIAVTIALIVWNVLLWWLVKKRLNVNCFPVGGASNKS